MKLILIILLIFSAITVCDAMTTTQFHLLARLANCWLCDSSCDCYQVWNQNQDNVINYIDYALIFGK